MLIVLELTEQQATYICQNSLERILNTAITMAEIVEIDDNTNDYEKEQANISYTDLKEHKQIFNHVFNNIRNEIFIESNKDNQ